MSNRTNHTERRRRVRRLAVQMLYQIDARNGEDIDEVIHSLEEAGNDPADYFDGLWKVDAPVDSEEHGEAFARAKAAWDYRAEADRIATELSPDWPTYRQPVMDRNIIRLCWYEMTKGDIPPKVAVNEAVELGKVFGTERSGAFLNGVLDKMLKRVLKGGEQSTNDENGNDEGDDNTEVIAENVSEACEESVPVVKDDMNSE